jgi:pimeloyl-ACP methyl ester carboxylesterase
VRAGETAVALEHGGHTVLEHWGESGPNILCVHGISSSRKGWTRFAERFYLANRVWAYDQRGHGDAADVHGPMTLEQGVRDLLAAAQLIPGGVDTLIGHSWGGAVVIRAALRLLPKRVIAIDPMVHVPPGEFFSEYVDELRPILAAAGAQREQILLDRYRGSHPLDLDAKIHAMAHMSIEPLERLGSENAVDAGRWDLREDLVSYPIPLFLAVAGVDSVVAPSALAFVREHGGPAISIKIYAGQGHSLQRSAFDEFASDAELFSR